MGNDQPTIDHWICRGEGRWTRLAAVAAATPARHRADGLMPPVPMVGGGASHVHAGARVCRSHSGSKGG
jgi:hypothetical protein